MRREISASGPLHPHAVWERYAELSEWKGWSPQIRWVEAAGERLAPGLTGTVHALFGVTAHFVVLDVDEAQRSWSWRVTTGPVGMTLHHAVRPHLDGTMTTLAIEGPAFLPLLYAPVGEVALRRLVRP
jgi:hypothetical protein